MLDTREPFVYLSSFVDVHVCVCVCVHGCARAKQLKSLGYVRFLYANVIKGVLNIELNSKPKGIVYKFNAYKMIPASAIFIKIIQ